MAIFNSYVSLPEGTESNVLDFLKMFQLVNPVVGESIGNIYIYTYKGINKGNHPLINPLGISKGNHPLLWPSNSG